MCAFSLGYHKTGHTLPITLGSDAGGVFGTWIVLSAYQVQGVSLRSLYKRSTGHVTFTIDPVRDLLIWAIIQNHRELAGIIWAQVPGLT